MTKKTFLSTIMSVVAMTFAGQAHAFLTDTSNQSVIMIGKGGAENMRAVQAPEVVDSYEVTEVTLPATLTTTTTTTQLPRTAPQAAYQDPYAPQPYTSPNTYTYNNATTNTGVTYQGTTYQGNYNNQFDRLAVTTNSAAVVVVDMQTGKPIYEKNVDATRSIASITKMMTAMVVLDANQDMRDEIIISASDLVGAKSASTRLKAGDRLSRSEFMLMMLMKSENPAAKTLASNYPGGYHAFIAAMNQKAQSLGMYQTRFSDASGLDPRNVSSASDLVKMMREISSNPRYQTIRNFSVTPSYDFYITNYNSGSRTYSANNTSSLVRSGSYALGASKTGFIREAGYCVVMEAHVNGRPSVIVLLGANASQNRWKDAETILGQLAYRY